MSDQFSIGAGHLLLVDDDPISLTVLERHLDQAGFRTRSATGGEAAWGLLETVEPAFDVVILDRVMPGLDGLALLARIRSDPRLSLTPVVLQTAASSPREMLEGFEAGASYYLTKPLDPVMLQAVVKAAVAEARGVAELREQLQQEELGLLLLREARFEFRTLGEAKRLAALVAHAYPDPERVLLGLYELLANAVEHGNLGISYAEKGALLEANGLMAEIERRLRLDPFASRRAQLRLERHDDWLVIHVEDEGAGFDVTPYLDFQPERAFDPHGRGIAMARQSAFDELHYLGKGNVARARVRI